jgi:hypothetical protein
MLFRFGLRINLWIKNQLQWFRSLQRNPWMKTVNEEYLGLPVYMGWSLNERSFDR